MNSFLLEYEIPDGIPTHGECVAECKLEGFALWNNNSVCELCGTAGCTECDSAGMCTACDEKKGLRLVDDMSGDGTKMCAGCMLETMGCKLCADDDINQCKMCKMGKSLIERDGNKMCIERCPGGTFKEKKTMDKAMVPDMMKNLDYNECTDCSADCSQCKGADDFCLQCSADDKFAQPDGSCATTCPAGTYPRDGKCKKCGPNIKTCEIDLATKEFKAKTCDDDFFVDINEKRCVEESRCGKGSFGDVDTGKCAECDGTKCIECKGGADKCTKCSDLNKFASMGGSCVDDPTAVTCETGFYNNAGICVRCNNKCDGCTGKGDTKCKACAANMVAIKKLVLSGPGASTVYTCDHKCPPLHEKTDDSGVPLCVSCPKHDTKKVFDISTHTCIDTSAPCPAKTVKMKLENLPRSVDASALSTSGNHSEIDVCAPCSKRCDTCNPLNPNWCLTCASGLFTNEFEHTDPTTGTKTTYIKCQEKCKPGTFPDSDGICNGSCLANCTSCEDGLTCDKCRKGLFKDDITDAANHVCVPHDQCPAKSYGDMMTGNCKNCNGE